MESGGASPTPPASGDQTPEVPQQLSQGGIYMDFFLKPSNTDTKASKLFRAATGICAL